MKKNILSLLLLAIVSVSVAQEWTWMKGTDTLTRPGIYGTMGVSSPSNNPGSRHGAATWVDNSGNLWLFGGEGVTTNTVLCWLNDLWKYDVITNEWTWVRGTNLPNQNGTYGTKGVPAPGNNPGAREFMMSWTDASGNFWLFGGDGFPASGAIGRLNDLWRYNPTTNEWTWMHGANVIGQNGIYGTQGISAPANTPGARFGSAKWVDATGNLWLCAGYGFPASGLAANLNDLWKYNIASNEWTWMNGLNTGNQYGIYGTKGVAAPGNYPGAREFPVGWTDKNGDLWFFGGGGYPAAGSQGLLQDLWKYTITSNTWTWMNGSNLINVGGVYNSINVASPNTLPGGRYASAAWTDQIGNLWLFGGTGYTNLPFPGRLNDMFMYNISTGEWSWEHGNPANDPNGIYGIQTVSAPFTTPGGRYYNTWWAQSNGKFWLFGGLGLGANGNSQNNLNDLWKFSASCAPVNLTATSALSTCEGNTVSLLASTSNTAVLTWYGPSSSTTSIGTGSVLTTPTLSSAGTGTTYVYQVEANACPVRTSITITVNPTPTVSIFTDNPLICAGTTLTLTANGATSYTWNTSATSNFISVSPSVTTVYSVTATDANGCIGTALLTQSVSLCTGISTANVPAWETAVIPNPNSGNFVVSSTVDGATFYLFNALGQLVVTQRVNKGDNPVQLNLAKGIYYYRLKDKANTLQNGKMLVD